MTGNGVYIGIGLTIIAALLAALVAPFFVDWNAYRPSFEAAATRVIGLPVSVRGPIEARLLPTPLVRVGEVVVGDTEAPLVRIARYEMWLEIAPLLKGEIKVAEMKLDRPIIEVFVAPDGKLRLPIFGGARNEAGQVAIEAAEITDGSVEIIDERTERKLRLEQVTATASAPSLAGPIKLEGKGIFAGQPVGIRLGISRRPDGGDWAVKLAATLPDSATQGTLDATLKMDTERLKVSGALVAQRTPETSAKGDRSDRAPPAWRAEAKIEADSARARFTDISISLGAEERALQLSGSGEARLGADAGYALKLTGRQADLDRILVRTRDVPDPSETAARLTSLVAGLTPGNLEGTVEIDLPAVVLGGGLISDVRATLRPRASEIGIDRLSAQLPGQSAIELSGNLNSTYTFTGRGKFRSEQPSVFSAWLHRDQPPVRMEPFAVEGQVQLSPEVWAIREMALSIGLTEARGALDWDRGNASRPSHLSAKLRSEALDLGQVRDLSTLAGLTDDSSKPGGRTSLDLEAGTVALGGALMKGFSAKIELAGDVLAIEQLTVADAAGAAFSAKGRIADYASAPDGDLAAHVTAERPEGLVKLVRSFVGAGPAGDRIAAMLGESMPLVADLKLTGKATGADSAVKFSAEGSAAGTRIALGAGFTGRADRWRDGAISLTSRMDSGDSGKLLRLLGLGLPGVAAAPGSLSLDAKGTAAGGLATTFVAKLAGADLQATGRVDIDPDLALRASGLASMATTDVTPLATTLGQALPVAPAGIPASLKGGLEIKGREIALTGLTGQIAGTPVSGTLTLAPKPDWTLGGKLNVGAIDLGSLSETLFGPGSSPRGLKATDPWPVSALSGPIGTLNVALALTVDRIGIDERRALDRAALQLSITPGETRIDDFSARLGGGKVTAGLGARRGRAGDIALEAEVGLQGVPWSEVSPRRDGRDPVSGQLDLTSTFTTQGTSIAGLIGNASGGGTFSINRPSLRSVDARLFKSLATEADRGMEAKDDRVRAQVTSRMDMGTWFTTKASGSFLIAAGTLRLRDVAASGDGANLAGSANIDLSRWTVDGNFGFTGDTGQITTTTAPAPRLGIALKGPVDRPDRVFDVSGVTSWLTIRALEREAMRADVLRQDMMERERFAREAKRMRQEEDARRKAEDDARRKAADDARAAATAAAAAQLPAAPATPASPAPVAPAPVATNPPAASLPTPVSRPAPVTVAPPVPTPAPAARPAPPPATAVAPPQPTPEFGSSIRSVIDQASGQPQPAPQRPATTLAPLPPPMVIGPQVQVAPAPALVPPPTELPKPKPQYRELPGGVLVPVTP